jgi:prephenate dehydrogenase (NADP+)
MLSGQFVSRCSDYIIYSVEAKNIDAVVKACGPCMTSPATGMSLS